KRMLHHAAMSIPFYRDFWRTRGGGNRGGPFLELSNWPVLKKESVRKHPEAFLSLNSGKDLRMEHTSGTTGTPLKLWHDRTVARSWYALMEARWRGWYGVSRQDRWGILGGRLVTPIEQKKPPFWVWNAGLRQLYLSSYHLSPDTVGSYIEALRCNKVKYLWGYASSLFSLAILASEQRLEPPQLEVVISNAEPLYAHQREIIRGAFGCPVRDTFGMSEMVCGVSECEAGKMHLWPEAGLVEILEDNSDDPVPHGMPGRLICTGLLNDVMPLIRYETGDRAILAPPWESCPCGRTLPILRHIEGRQDDLIVTPDRRRVGRLDPVFKADLAIREAQVIQETATRLRIKVVPTPTYCKATRNQLIDALRQRVGAMEIQVECVEQIPRGANGKFRAVLSCMTPAGRPRQT
ncbi:MAG: hypothetical protein DME22_08005, partial [Verrucomicrobia bacterium]